MPPTSKNNEEVSWRVRVATAMVKRFRAMRIESDLQSVQGKWDHKEGEGEEDGKESSHSHRYRYGWFMAILAPASRIQSNSIVFDSTACEVQYYFSHACNYTVYIFTCKVNEICFGPLAEPRSGASPLGHLSRDGDLRKHQANQGDTNWPLYTNVEVHGARLSPSETPRAPAL